jgi:hypothetical protein
MLSFPELYVKSVYLNLFGWTGSVKSMKHLKMGASFKSLATSGVEIVRDFTFEVLHAVKMSVMVVF